jgi:hypothetical protein
MDETCEKSTDAESGHGVDAGGAVNGQVASQGGEEKEHGGKGDGVESGSPHSTWPLYFVEEQVRN